MGCVEGAPRQRELIDQHLLHRAGRYYLLTDTGAAAYKALCERYFI